MADALEDDFAASDVESIGGKSEREVGSDVALEEKLGRPKSVRGKRAGGESAPGQEEETEEERRRRKKRKMKENDKSRKAKKVANRAALGPGQVAAMPPDMQADHLRKLVKMCKQFAKLSDLELDEIALRENMLVDTSRIKVERTEEKLVDFVKAAMPTADKSIAAAANADAPKQGQPVVLVVTGNAQRAADIAKALRRWSPTAVQGPSPKPLPVAKLFARHFKLAEQQAFLGSNACPLAVGTPQRLHDLLADGGTGPLQLDQVKAIVLDASWADAKKRTLLDGIETREALCALLASAQVQARLKTASHHERAAILLF